MKRGLKLTPRAGRAPGAACRARLPDEEGTETHELGRGGALPDRRARLPDEEGTETVLEASRRAAQSSRARLPDEEGTETFRGCGYRGFGESRARLPDEEGTETHRHQHLESSDGVAARGPPMKRGLKQAGPVTTSAL